MDLYRKRSGVPCEANGSKEPFMSIESRKKLQNKFNKIKGIHVTNDKLDKRPSFDLSVLKDDNIMKLFIDVFKLFIEKVKKYVKVYSNIRIGQLANLIKPKVRKLYQCKI